VRKRGTTTSIQQEHILGHVSAPVRDCSRAQLLDVPREIHVFDNILTRPGHRRVTRNTEKLTYEEIFQALEEHFGDQHFAAAFHSQLKTRTQKAGESLQDFATAFEQLTHRAYPTLPEDHIRREAGKAFTDGVEDQDKKFHF
jgi:hypothetical protein